MTGRRTTLVLMAFALTVVTAVNSSALPPVRLFHKPVEKQAAATVAVADDPTPPQPAPPPLPPPLPVEPQLILPATVEGDVGSFIKIKAQTNASHVRWVPIDKGLAVFPGEMLKDSTSTVVMSAVAGQYRMLAYTALSDIPSDPVTCLVVVHGHQPPPAPVPPQPVPPQPGPQPGPAPAPAPAPVNPTAAKLFVAVIDNVSTRDPRTAAILNDMGFWNGLTAQGHFFVKLNTTETDAVKYKQMIDANGGVPVVVILDGTSYVPGQSTSLKWLNKRPEDLKLPTTTAGLQALVNRYVSR